MRVAARLVRVGLISLLVSVITSISLAPVSQAHNGWHFWTWNAGEISGYPKDARAEIMYQWDIVHIEIKARARFYAYDEILRIQDPTADNRIAVAELQYKDGSRWYPLTPHIVRTSPNDHDREMDLSIAEGMTIRVRACVSYRGYYERNEHCTGCAVGSA